MIVGSILYTCVDELIIIMVVTVLWTLSDWFCLIKDPFVWFTIIDEFFDVNDGSIALDNPFQLLVYA